MNIRMARLLFSSSLASIDHRFTRMCERPHTSKEPRKCRISCQQGQGPRAGGTNQRRTGNRGDASIHSGVPTRISPGLSGPRSCHRCLSASIGHIADALLVLRLEGAQSLCCRLPLPVIDRPARLGSFLCFALRLHARTPSPKWMPHSQVPLPRGRQASDLRDSGCAAPRFASRCSFSATLSHIVAIARNQ
jgi:hypothetical protein